MRLSALAAILVLFAGSTAQAGFLQTSYTTGFSNGSSGTPTPSGSIPQFNLGGRLYSVLFEFEVYTVGGFLDVFNQTDQWISVSIDFTDFAALGVVPNFTGPIDIFAGAVPATPFVNDLDPFGGFSGIGTGSYLKGTYQTQDALEKAAYTGSGELQFVTTHAFQITSVSPDSAVFIGFSPDYYSSGTVTVTYVYEASAPAGLLLGFTALPGLLFVRRLSRR